ncbi:MAG: DUF72 domain-containing protein [Candidatus Acidiferrales bacterium]
MKSYNGGAMGTIYAGTSGWAYTSWKRGFYPPTLASKDFLRHYATRLNSVEVNYTFRQLASAETLSEWVDATGASFRFAVKAHQTITHIKRLRDAAAITGEFFESIEPLRKARKLGPVLFQLPPNFKCDIARLREFLAELPKRLRVAFEFRHESWFVEEVYAALRKKGVALCLAESEKIETPEVRTADFCYLRLRKPSYTPKDVIGRVRRLARDGDVYVYFKHEDTPEGALNAEALLQTTQKK